MTSPQAARKITTMIQMHPLEYTCRSRGKTIADLARRVGADRSGIQHWMAGRGCLGIDKVRAIARHLHVSQRYLSGPPITLVPKSKR